eukprot:TRINITY_DN9321_c0_g1_i1.p1 TRINITY_DN9321_c0_g1~~TRINITY_DN9321_c0_g1_i1.p1  ORF type:complete len:451 (+),score=90.83 TRINITY_DN9321_c0_g1_i1:49-1353(+)
MRAFIMTLGALCSSTKISVMLPLDTVTSNGQLKNKGQLSSNLDQLKNAGVDGIMADVWWGVTEKSAKQYDFSAYAELVEMAKSRGLTVQFVTSFHQCGGNVGDTCNIPVPSFVSNAPGIWYKDQNGNEDKEYISLFADNVSVAGRTPLDMYNDWFSAFASAFADDLGKTIDQVQVGMGPAGELRYPSYQLSRWHFCGVGAFQAFDEHALASLKAFAEAASKPQFSSPPRDAGDYNSRPDDTNFFRSGYQTDGGRFFLDWYFKSLKTHGANVLSRARAALGQKVNLAGKVAGIHWWYKSPHHAAEVTAGYYNTNSMDAYAELAAVFAAEGRDAAIDFTCLEMADSEQDPSCGSGPEELVRQVASAAQSKSVAFNGENALPRYDDVAFGKIESYRQQLEGFTYLRLSDVLLQGDNLNRFRQFVQRMHQKQSAELVV